VSTPGTPINGRYYDGASARLSEVQVRFGAGGAVTLYWQGEEHHYPAHDVSIGDRLGNTARVITLADGARLEIDDNDAIDHALAAISGRRQRHLLHGLEKRWTLVLLALLITVGLGVGMVTIGVPALAKIAAEGLPRGVESVLSEQSIALMDRGLFRPSELSDVEKDRVRELFQRVQPVGNDGFVYDLLFRDAPALGANAFAMPSGTVVITDDLIRLAVADDELLGVLAHEVGHVVGRHALRQVLQNGSTALLIGVITGDITTASTLAASLPTLFVEAHYARDFEREADQYAADWMHTHQVDPTALGHILERMGGGDSGATNWLSSHPATPERAAHLAAP